MVWNNQRESSYNTGKNTYLFMKNSVGSLFHNKRWISFFLKLKLSVSLALLLLVAGFTDLHSQNFPINVNVQVLPPYSNDIHEYLSIEDKLTRDFQEQVIVTIRNNNPNRSYEIKLISSVTSNTGVSVRVNEDFQPLRKIIIPAGDMKVLSGTEITEVNRNITENDITTEGVSRQQILRTGVLPEGSYQVCVRALDFRSGEPLSPASPMGCSPPITIEYPDPPVIAYPFDGAEILATDPQSLNISWAPSPNLSSSVRYRVRIVELNDINANPYDLMEQTTISFFEERDITTTNLFYDQTKPQLKEGHTYAIRIQAYDPTGTLQIKNDGLSEIHTFTYVDRLGTGETLVDVDYISLVPGYVRLVNLEDLSVRDLGDSEVYDGNAGLEITTPSAVEAPRILPVQVNNLNVQKGNYQNPVISSGEVAASVTQLPAALSDLDQYMNVDQVRWEAGTGLMVRGSLVAPNDERYQASGPIQLTDIGVYGTITAENEDGSPLFDIGEVPLRLVVNRLKAYLPDNKFVADGELLVFSDPYQIESCTVENINFSENSASTNISCQVEREFNLVGESDKTMLEVKSIRGVITPDWANGQLGYDLETIAKLNIQSMHNNTCGINTLISLNDQSGVEAQIGGSTCYATTRTFDLGLVEMIAEDLELSEFTYDSELNEWDFSLSMNTYLRFPVFDNWTSPRIEDLEMNRVGIVIPDQEWNESSLQDADAINWNDLELDLQSLSISEINYPWFEEITGPGPWQVAFGGEVLFPESGGFPECLRTTVVEMNGNYDQAGGLSAEVSAENISCTWDFGAGYALVIEGVEGELTTSYRGDSFEKSFSLRLDANMQVGIPFSCGNNTLEVADTDLFIRNGLIEGQINDFVPDCPVEVGPFEATITQSDISFYSSAEEKSADLDATADLTLADGTSVNGTFLLDMITGRFKEIEFRLDEPFTWEIPEEDPVLTFYIEEAVINENGFLIDGRNELQLPEQSIGATFDNLLLDLSSRKIKSGSIIFDERFALEAGLDPQSMSLDYNAVSAGEDLTVSPGVYFGLAEQIILDSLGLRTGGSAQAALIYEDRDLAEDFSVDFTDDFSIQLYPFSVRKGRADFIWEDKRIAYIDPQGFNIDPAKFAIDALPDSIPLPTGEIAYLVIKENDQLLADVTKQNDGSYRVNTKPNQPLSLFIPILDPANPPEIADVTLNNVVLKADLSSPAIKSGSITATVPPNDPRFNLTTLDIPLDLQEISYGTNLNNNNLTALYLTGDLYIFNQNVTNSGNVSLTIQSDGNVQGNFNLQPNSSVNLVQGSDLVTLDIDQVNGTFNLPLSNQGNPSYDIDLTGGFSVNAPNGTAASADLMIKLTPGDFAVTQFNPVVNTGAPEIDLGYFGVKINEIPSIPEFNYNRGTGFDFAATIDMELSVELTGNQSFTIPLDGIEISDTGLKIPPQDISNSSIPGLNLPSINLQGVEIKPLALRTTTETVFDWYNQVNLNINPELDFEVRLPAFQGTGFNPQDGFSFYNVQFNQGILTGSMSPYSPPGDVFVPLSNLAETARLKIDEVSGAFTRLTSNNTTSQGIDIDIDGSLHDIPGFTEVDPNVCVEPSLSLSIVQGEGFEGTINDFIPCGAMELGPFSLEAQSSTLTFAYQNQQQSAEMDGTVRLNFIENPQTGGLADGNLAIDLVEGELINGYIEINQSFPFSLPVNANPPILDFTVNQARLDTSGFEFSGNGSLEIANTSTSVTFNNLLLSLNDFSVKSGSANLGSAFAMQLGLRPIALSLVDTSSTRPAADHLRMEFDGDVMFNQYGLGYNATATAAIRFAGEDFPVLRAEFLNNFGFDIVNFKVTRGRAEFFLDENGQATDPLAILDTQGFRMGGGVVAMLPDTLGLPTKDVAYIILKNQQGDPVLDVNQTQNGGYQLTNRNNQPLTIVFPGLKNGSNNTPQTQVTLDLTTDSNYNPVSGSISLVQDVDLEPYFNVPLLLTQVTLAANSNTELEVGVALDLPPSITADTVKGNLRVSSTGFVQGSLEIGQYTNTYNSNIQPAYTHDFSGNISGSNEQGMLTVNIMGAQVTFGSNNTVGLSGTIESDLLADDQDNVKPVFYTASYNNGTWDAGIDASQLTNGIPMGPLVLQPDPNQPVYIIISQQEFVFAINGTLSFEELIGEPFDVHVDSLKVGVGVQPQTEVIFEMGAAVATLPDQNISLFSGKAEILLESPQVGIDGRRIGVSGDGRITVLDKDVDFTNMSINNIDGFSVDNMQVNNIELIDEYAKLQTLALSVQQSQLELSASIDVKLPNPVDASAGATFTLTRDQSNNVQADFSGPDFDLNNEYNLGDVAVFKLTKVAVDLEEDILSSGIYVTGEVLFNDQPRIRFGEANDIRNTPGIAITAGLVRYNATGNVNFTLEEGFFNITINANAAVSNATKFEVVLGGEAGVVIDGVGGTLDYEGFTITADGVSDRGNLTGSGSLTLMDYASLEIGKFVSKTPAEGEDHVTIHLPVKNDEDPAKLKDKAGPDDLETEPLDVKRYVQFGDSTSRAINLTLGGQNPSDNGGGSFKAGVAMVIFYEKMNGGVYLKVDDAKMAIGRTLEIHAGMEYETDGSGNFMLRAMATGEFYSAGTSAAVALAGSFSNMNDQVRFGLFVGVAAQPGVPLFPGIVELTGAAGGFFYNPKQADIDLITDPNSGVLYTAFDYQLVKGEITGDSGPPQASDYTFAAMLWASVGIVGSSGGYTFEGATFIKVTNQSVYIDARGVVLGLDGEGTAGIQVDGATYFEALFDQFYIDGALKLNMKVPVTMTGNMTLSFFLAKDPGNDEIVWGIEGDLSAQVFGSISPSGTLIACPSGVYISASIAANVLDFPIVTVKGSATGSMWYATDPSFNMPFGAYLRLKARFCVGFCMEPVGKAAFATIRGGGFELVAGLQACKKVIKGEACIHAMVRVKDGPRFSGSAGTGKLDSDLFRKAENMENRFQTMIDDIKDKINDVKDNMDDLEPDVPETTIPSEIVLKAGMRFHTEPLIPFYSISIMNNAEQVTSSVGNDMQWVYDNIMVNGASSAFPMVRITRLSSAWDEVEDEQTRMEQSIETSTLFLEAALTRVARAKATAYEYKEQANQSFNSLISSLETDPVQSVDSSIQTDAQGRIVSSPSFQVDQATAEQQRTDAENVTENFEQMDEEFRKAITSIESNLDELNELLTEPLEVDDSESTTSASTPTGLVSGDQTINQVNFQSNISYDMQTLIAGTQLAIGLPSLDGVAASLSRAMERIDKYYATRISFNWRKRAWVKYAYNQLIGRKSQILNEVNSLWNQAQSMSDNEIKDNSVERMDLLYSIADESGDKQAAKQDHRDEMNKSRSDMEARFKESAEVLWYYMHDSALSDLTYELAAERISGLMSDHNAKKGILEPSYSDLTSGLDDAYSLKSDIISLLYGLYDKYDNWRENVLGDNPGDSAQVAISQRKQELEDLLKPPQIAGVNVTSNRNHYYNHSEVSWSITGTSEETSYQVAEYENTENIAGSGMSPSDPYLTAGFKTSIDIYPYRTQYRRDPTMDESGQFYHAMPISVGLRVRSKGGVSILRRAQFDVNVGPNGNATTLDNIQVLESDNTAPKIRQAALNYDIAKDQNQTDRYWTNSDQLIQVFVRAQDNETDIAEFEYAIGTTSGATDVVNWSPLLGDRSKLTLSGDRYWGEDEDFMVTEMRGDITALTLQPGQPYYISVRVTNGVGTTSQVKTIEPALVYDATKPSPPGNVYTFAPAYTFYSMGSGINATYYPAATSPPDFYRYYMHQNEIDNAFENAPLPQISQQWNAATDNESGIKEYEYIVSPDSAISAEDFEGYVSDTEQTSLTMRAYNNEPAPVAVSDEPYIAEFSGSPIKHYEPYYIHVRALNHAGSYSDIKTLGPVTPTDPSSPWEPEMQVMDSYNNIKLYLTKNSFDPESGLLGYQYAVGTSTSSADIRSFPSGDEVDYDYSNYDAYKAGFSLGNWGYGNNNYSDENTDPVFSLSKDNLPQGKIYVFIRAVNTQGKYSSIAVSGPIYYDESAPESPSISTDLSNDKSEVTVTASNLHDPESGIKEIEYQLSGAINGILTTSSWANFKTVYSIFTDPRSYDRTFDIGDYDPGSVTVKIRVTNAADDQTVASKMITLADGLIQQQNQANNYNFNY